MTFAFAQAGGREATGGGGDLLITECCSLKGRCHGLFPCHCAESLRAPAVGKALCAQRGRSPGTGGCPEWLKMETLSTLRHQSGAASRVLEESPANTPCRGPAHPTVVLGTIPACQTALDDPLPFLHVPRPLILL